MKLRKVGIALLLLLSVGVTAACSGGGKKDGYPEITKMNDSSEYKEVFSSCTINTDNVKTTYYLGESLDFTGLKVYRNYLSYDSNNKRVDIPMKVYETIDYTVDTEAVDIHSVGKYPVVVSVRVGTLIRKQTFDVTVKSSVFESSAGTNFIAGLDVKYTDGETVKEYTKNDPIDISTSDISVVVHQRHVNVDLTFTDSVINHDVSKLSIDLSKINNKVVGAHMIKVTYDNGDITVDGKSYPNKVTSYVLVNVKNDAVSMEPLDSNNDEFAATLEDIDFSSWKISIEREVDTEVVNFSYDLFDVDDLDPFKWNENQKITLTLKENRSVKCYPEIFINESETQDIKKYNNLTQGTASNGEVPLAGTNFIFGPESTAANSKEVKYEARTKDNYGSLLFPVRLTMKGSANPIRIVMDKPGQLVLFFASTGDEERELSLLNSAKEEIETAVSASTKQTIVKYIFTCPSAGTYYLVNPAGGLYIHGIVVATNK